MKQISIPLLLATLLIPLLSLCGETERKKRDYKVIQPINVELPRPNRTNNKDLPKWDDPNIKGTLETTLFPKISFPKD